MSKVATVYHSGYGHTAEIARAVARGASQVQGTTVQSISVAEADSHWDDLAAADAMIFGAPTYMGSASAQFKVFADASSKVWFSQGWKDKITAGFTHSGSVNGDK
jgi:NAD(P)H dehydrogenase (quinone)